MDGRPLDGGPVDVGRGSGLTSKSHWRRLELFAGDAPRQMAFDDALLWDAGGDGSGLSLRFYTWRPGSLSLGYFQALAQVPAVTGRTPGSVVRRLTGGGAIDHERELTYALAAPSAHPLFAGPVADSAARVHRAVAGTLETFGVHAELRGERPLASDVPDTGLCFHASSPLDLVWQRADGRWAKGVGSAQRRSADRVLHHGSIKLAAGAPETEIAGVGDVDLQQLCDALAASFEAQLGIVSRLAQPTSAELEHVEQRSARFAAPEFLGRDRDALRAMRRLDTHSL